MSYIILIVPLITESGSTMAARHAGMIVATVYGTTVRKNSESTWVPSMLGVILKSGYRTAHPFSTGSKIKKDPKKTWT